MKRITYAGLASLLFLFAAAAPSAAQPSSEESINVWADTLDSTNQVDLAVYTVPPGKQLIIDYLSMRSYVPAGELVVSAGMNLPYVHFLTVNSQGATENRSYFASAQKTRIVVEPNQTIAFRVERSNHGTPAYVTVAIAGRLVSKK